MGSGSNVSCLASSTSELQLPSNFRYITAFPEDTGDALGHGNSGCRQVCTKIGHHTFIGILWPKKWRV